jgi:hypothetical protein
MPHILFYFKIDGKEYDVSPFVDSGKWYSSATSQTDLLEYDLGIVLSGWKAGEMHLIEYGYVQDAVINDGWSEWQPITMDYSIIAIPVDGPVNTPTLEASWTPSPVINTPRPTVMQPTETQSCSAEAQISVTNSTGDSVKLILSGPAYYSFNLDTGDTILNVCSGSYSYSAYGCGGAYDQGSIDAGSSHEFYCTSN